MDDDPKKKAFSDMARIFVAMLAFCGVFSSFVTFISGANLLGSIILIMFALIVNLYVMVFL